MVDLATPAKKDARVSDSDSDEDFSDAVVIPENDSNNNDKLSRQSLSFVNTNVRSLAPKIESLNDCMVEKVCALTLITDTLLQDN